MKEKAQVLDEFVLKIIGIVTMTLDHIGVILMNSGYFAEGSGAYICGYAFRIIGRLAFPLFALMLAEGLRHTKDRANYILRLALIWALVFVVELVLYYGNLGSGYATAQAFTDLLLYALFIYLLEQKGWKKGLAILPLAYIVLCYSAYVSETYAASSSLTSVWSQYFPELFRGGYNLYGFLMFLGFYYAPKIVASYAKKSFGNDDEAYQGFLKSKGYQGMTNTIYISVLVIVTVFFWALSYMGPIDPYYMSQQTYCLVDAILLFLYNGKRGYDKKWFRYSEYLYYPVHLALIGLIFSIIFA